MKRVARITKKMRNVRNTRKGWDERRRFAGNSDEGIEGPLRRRAEAKVGRTRR